MDRIAPDPFLRGVLPGVSWEHGSRLAAAALAKLPIDTVRAARIPAGVHLALTGTATAIELQVRVGERTSVPAPTVAQAFVARVAGADPVVTPVSHPAGDIALRVELPVRDADATVRVYLPESVEVVITSLAAVDGSCEPAARGPLFVAYGDSITQGWSVTEPGLAWPSLVGDELGLDVVNLGFAGSARGELLAADAVAASGADVVALAWGTNAWSSLPTDAAAITEQMRLFLTALRQGLPDAPVVVVSPIARPDAESTPNRFGATHTELRDALEVAVHRFVARTRDRRITLVPGRHLVPAEQLVDGIHPGDAGQAAIAAGVLPIIRDALAAGVGAPRQAVPSTSTEMSANR